MPGHPACSRRRSRPPPCSQTGQQHVLRHLHTPSAHFIQHEQDLALQLSITCLAMAAQASNNSQQCQIAIPPSAHDSYACLLHFHITVALHSQPLHLLIGSCLHPDSACLGMQTQTQTPDVVALRGGAVLAAAAQAHRYTRGAPVGAVPRHVPRLLARVAHGCMRTQKTRALVRPQQAVQIVGKETLLDSVTEAASSAVLPALAQLSPRSFSHHVRIPSLATPNLAGCLCKIVCVCNNAHIHPAGSGCPEKGTLGNVLRTIGALRARVAELGAQVAGARARLVGAVSRNVPLPAALEAALPRRLKVLVKVPAANTGRSASGGPYLTTTPHACSRCCPDGPGWYKQALN